LLSAQKFSLLFELFPLFLRIYKQQQREVRKMSTAGNIRAYIDRLPLDKIFSTREVLHFGKRGSVDQALYRMVNNYKIVRLAWGLFVKFSEELVIPSVAEIATEKSRAFCKDNIMHGQDAAFELRLVEAGNEHTIFNVPGSASSSFMCIVQRHRVYTKATSARRIVDGDKRVGKVIRALWQLGPANLNHAIMKSATLKLNRIEVRILWQAALRVPYWLAGWTNSNIQEKKRFN